MNTQGFFSTPSKASFILWAFTPDDSRDAQLRRYGDYLLTLLGGELRMGFPGASGNGNGDNGRADASGQLMLYGESDQRLLRRLLAGRSYKRILKRCESSLLIVNQPRIPINHILLVLRTEEIDETAVEWLIRLAQPSEADVTVLPVLPMIPVVHSFNLEPHQELSSLLSPNTRDGALLREISGRLVRAHIEANLHLRQGEPMWQLKQELVACDYDLIIVGEDPVGLWARWFGSELAALLLRCTSKPVLVARCPSSLERHQ